MSSPISNVTRIWVRGRMIDMARAATGENKYGAVTPVQFVPAPKVLINADLKQIISAGPFKVVPDETTGYFQIPLPATDDPDVNPVNWTYRVNEGATGRIYDIVVPQNTPILNAPGDPLNGLRVLDLSSIAPAVGPSSGIVQLVEGRGVASIDIVDDQFVATYTDDTTQVIGDVPAGGGTVADATTSTKGKARILGGTADAPTVPYTSVTGAPTSLPPSGGAGGVLAGSFPNPSFAVDMATQAELDAVPFRAANTTTSGLVAGGMYALAQPSAGQFALRDVGGVAMPGALNFLAARALNPVATLTLSGPGGSSPVSGTNKPYNTTAVTRLGCVPTLVSQYGTDYHRNAVNGPGTPATWAIEFLTDATEIAIWFRAVTTAADIWVWADGRPTTRDPVTLSGLAGGSLYYEKIAFPTAGLRDVRIYLDRMDFGGLDHPAGTIVQPLPTAVLDVLPSVAVYGDSWVEGTSEDTSASPWPSLMASALGWSFFKCGCGGTGYIEPGVFAPNYQGSARLDALAAAAPDLVVVEGGINDRGNTSGAVQTAAAAVYAGLASRLPSTPVIVIGPPPIADPQGSDLLAVRDGVKAAALAASNVVEFIDPIAGRWFYGTGKQGSETGDGIADFALRPDNVHPTRYGEITFAQHATGRILAACDREGIVI